MFGIEADPPAVLPRNAGGVGTPTKAAVAAAAAAVGGVAAGSGGLSSTPPRRGGGEGEFGLLADQKEGLAAGGARDAGERAPLELFLLGARRDLGLGS